MHACTIRLIKQYLQWQWRLYGHTHFKRELAVHLWLIVLVTYVGITSKYKHLEGKPLYE